MIPAGANDKGTKILDLDVALEQKLLEIDKLRENSLDRHRNLLSEVHQNGRDKLPSAPILPHTHTHHTSSAPIIGTRPHVSPVSRGEATAVSTAAASKSPQGKSRAQGKETLTFRR